MVRSSLDSKGVTVKANSSNVVKFLCSYGGKILPRYPDGELRYTGGVTRILAVDRSISFAELLLKLGELYGSSVSFRCQLPTVDLDALVSVTSDEDLANVIEEYDRTKNPSLKIRAFLSPAKSIKKISPPSSATPSIADTAAASKSFHTVSGSRSLFPADQYFHHMSPPVGFLLDLSKPCAGKLCYHPCYAQQRNPCHICIVHNGKHWQ